MSTAHRMDADVAFLLERVQQSFGVRLPPGELTEESRLSDLCNSVSGRLAHTRSGKCCTSVVFWRLRRAFVELFGASRHAATARTPTDLLLPRRGRRKAWRRLAASSGLKLPGLEYSGLLNHVIFFGSAAGPFWLVATWGHSWKIGFASFVLWPLTASILFMLLRPFAANLPARSLTMGDLARVVAGLNYGALARELGGASGDRELIEAVHNVIADLIDIEPQALASENPRLIDIVLANDGFRAET